MVAKSYTIASMKCAHCGGSKHTKETCFKLHGYPEWWAEFQARKKEIGTNNSKSNFGRNTDGADRTSGKGALAAMAFTTSIEKRTSDALNKNHERENEKDTCEHILTESKGNIGTAFWSFSTDSSKHMWLLDLGATDQMTFTALDFLSSTPPRRKSIANANGVLSPVTADGTVALSSTLKLSNTLLVPSLSHKLLSICQITKELNCVVLMYPKFYLLQDILTKEIIGRGTEKGGLYYMDDFGTGRAHLTHGSAEQQIWLWHRRLGHPSFSYMKHLFPTLFTAVSPGDFHCETCILAKSHRVNFSLSSNKNSVPFALIHSDVWGPAPVTSSSGYRWFVTFIDDCTR